MDNLLGQIDEELRNSRNRRLSEALIGCIVSLTQALRPYRYLEDDELTAPSLSPEQGQLLFALVNSDLAKETYDKIFDRANFSYADLRDANFTSAYMRAANLTYSYFSDANFRDADLAGADFSYAYLERRGGRLAEISWEGTGSLRVLPGPLPLMPDCLIAFIPSNFLQMHPFQVDAEGLIEIFNHLPHTEQEADGGDAGGHPDKAGSGKGIHRSGGNRLRSVKQENGFHKISIFGSFQRWGANRRKGRRVEYSAANFDYLEGKQAPGCM